MTARTPGPAEEEDGPLSPLSPLSLLAGRLAASLGAHPPGWGLPRTSELARRHGVSIAEMEAAVADLAARHVVRQLRDGQVYLASPAEYLTTFEPLPGLGSVIDPMGATITCTEQRIMQKPVPEEARRALRLAPGAQACTVQRSWTAGRCPAAVSTTYLPAYLASLLVPAKGGLPPEIAAILNPPSAYPAPARRPPGRARSTWRCSRRPPRPPAGSACARASRPSP